MRTKLIVLFASIVLLIVAMSYSDMDIFEPVTIFKERTQIGELDLSRVSLSLGNSILTKKLREPVYLNLTNQSRGVTPQDMGYNLDRDRLTKLTKTCKSKIFKLICVNTSNEVIDPNDVFTIDGEQLNNFLNELEAESQYLAKNNIISLSDYTFRAVAPDAQIKLNREIFTDKDKVAQMITADKFTVELDYETTADIEVQNNQTESLINNMTYPLLIKYGRYPIDIPSETLQDFITTETRDGLLYGKIETAPIHEYLDTLDEEYASDDIVVIRDRAVDAIRRGLLFRASNLEVNEAVILPLEGNPKTNGELHDVYLEIVKSQQRLYRFENGELVKTYIVSTGLTWDTPPGEYEVLGKTKMTISYFGNWYMPDYLPIGTIDGYRFGLHAIPYHMDANGNIYSRDPNTLGSPATGGCIQLANDDALELFNWAEVGTPVYIYE